ncbi:MAG TPA: cobalt transporter [Rhodospirillales bacterium]|nr:cobalt transporter [Rhodospirillales bacterium]
MIRAIPSPRPATDMFHRIVLSALLAGAIAGLWIFVGHITLTTPLILQAEASETAAAVTTDWMPVDGLERTAYTLLSDMVIAMGFAFLLVGAMSLSGRPVDWRRGLVWGGCGFIVFSVSPAIGLPPELPGMMSAELQARQIWWVGAAVAAIVGLYLIFLTERRVLGLLGLVVIILPHVIGAPQHEAYVNDIPVDLIREFILNTMLVSGSFWLILGGVAGHFYNKLERN